VQSNNSWTVEKVFSGFPVSFKLFEYVKIFIESLGNVAVTPTKTQVSFGVKRKFAWVWLPQMWIKKASRDCIVLTFSLDRLLADGRIKESKEPYPGRFTHHVVIEKLSDFDETVKGWLREAYDLASAAKRKRI